MVNVQPHLMPVSGFKNQDCLRAIRRAGYVATPCHLLASPHPLNCCSWRQCSGYATVCDQSWILALPSDLRTRYFLLKFIVYCKTAYTGQPFWERSDWTASARTGKPVQPGQDSRSRKAVIGLPALGQESQYSLDRTVHSSTAG